MLRERYDAVLHLVSAAAGAEQFYTTANNAQRYEQMNEEGLRIARLLDKKVIKAWTGHPHLRVINNHEDFDAKMKRVLREIRGVLGLPQPIEQERKYRIRITAKDQKDKKIHVSVFNEGPGITPADLPYIFERFYKSDKSRGLDKTGVGLGMYIARAIIDAHDEKIWVTSDYGENCEFTFTLTRAHH